MGRGRGGRGGGVKGGRGKEVEKVTLTRLTTYYSNLGAPLPFLLGMSVMFYSYYLALHPKQIHFPPFAAACPYPCIVKNLCN